MSPWLNFTLALVSVPMTGYNLNLGEYLLCPYVTIFGHMCIDVSQRAHGKWSGHIFIKSLGSRAKASLFIVKSWPRNHQKVMPFLFGFKIITDIPPESKQRVGLSLPMQALPKLRWPCQSPLLISISSLINDKYHLTSSILALLCQRNSNGISAS